VEPSNKAYAYATKDKSAESGGLSWIWQFSSSWGSGRVLILPASCKQGVNWAPD